MRRFAAGSAVFNFMIILIDVPLLDPGKRP